METSIRERRNSRGRNILRIRSRRKTISWNVWLTTLIILLFQSFSLLANNEAKLKTLYNSLDPYSITKHLAFYELYPETKQGKIALSHAWTLLTKPSSFSTFYQTSNIPITSIDALISFITTNSQESIYLPEETLCLIENLSRHLNNRKLKGFYAHDEKEILALAPDQIDLGKALLLAQCHDKKIIRQYQAFLDLMALQVLARIGQNASPEEKITAINRLIFDEMGFKFPPVSEHIKDIDKYTLLPNILNSRHGVCLGVSVLYLCIAQRINLPLEMITPPGHIYIRYKEGEKVINIETTARGSDVPTDLYLNIHTKALQKRNIKEVIGLVYMNLASPLWSQHKKKKLLSLYQKAFLYLKNDPQIKKLLAYALLLNEEKQKAKTLLKEALEQKPIYTVDKDSLAQDLYDEKVDIKSLQTLFISEKEDRLSTIKKQKEIEEILKSFPSFRSGYYQLALTFLKIHREKEALIALNQYHLLDPNHVMVEYYLTLLNAKRLNYKQAWTHYFHLEKILKKANYTPKELKHIKISLEKEYPY